MSEDRAHPTDASWEPQPRSPWRLLRNALLALIAIDLVLSLVAAAPPDPTLTLDGRDDLRHVLAKARDGGATLLIGDSVLAGDVLEGRVADWQQQRVIDQLRREVGEGGATFEQVALNGVGLRDVLGVLAELDRVDPEASVSVVVEVNPRYFSANARPGCAHDWLCGRLQVGSWNRGWRAVRDGLDDLEPWLPVVRHRRYLVPDLDAAGGVFGRPAATATADKAEGRARILAHYEDPDLDGTAMEHLALIRKRLLRTGRTATFFATPLNDAFFDGHVSPESLGLVSARVAETVPLVELDHPLFRPDHFVDHCHLTPEGNRLLALNLLRELGEPLRSLPSPGEIARPLDMDETLVASLKRGMADGPSWVARFDGPADIARRSDGRLAIADRLNDAIRVVDPPYQTVRTLPLDELEQPLGVAWIGDRLFVLSESGQVVQAVVDGALVEVIRLGASGRATQIEASEGALWLAGQRGKIRRVDPDSGKVRTVLEAVAPRQIRAFEVVKERLIVADDAGRLIAVPTDGSYQLVEAQIPDGGELLFANAGKRVPPKPDGPAKPYFPMSFDRTRIGRVEGLDWIERYGVMLVRWEAKDYGTFGDPGQVHWRVFDLEERQVHAWIRPRRFGGSYLMWNRQAQDWASPWQPGSVAIDPETASVFFVERDRSRLVRLRDGVLGAAQISHATSPLVMSGSQERFGDKSGQRAADRFEPVQHLGALGGPDKLRGPYSVLYGGSSMTVMSDQVGMYSMARALGEHLRAELGYRDRVGVELFQRVRPGGGLPSVVKTLEAGAETTAPDVILVGLWEPPALRPEFRDRAAIADAVARLQALGERWDAKVIAVDSVAMSRLRTTPGFLEERKTELQAAGIDVVDLGDQYLHQALGTSPWGIPPFTSRHAAPWSIDAAAELLNAQIALSIRAHLRGRTPSWRAGPREPAPLEGRSYVGVVGRLPKAPAVDEGAIVSERDGATLELLLDLSRTPVDAAPEAVAVAVARAGLMANPSVARVTHLRVRLVRFEAYDEYGQGASRGAETVLDETWTPEELLAVAAALGR